jgi:(p)ppGpp synthase/HD superfamily hydrolase
VVKLAGRLHIMRTLEYLYGEKRRRIAQINEHF